MEYMLCWPFFTVLMDMREKHFKEERVYLTHGFRNFNLRSAGSVSLGLGEAEYHIIRPELCVRGCESPKQDKTGHFRDMPQGFTSSSKTSPADVSLPS